MTSIAADTQSVNWEPNTYQHKAYATRRRRRAAGCYNRPTKAHKAVYAKLTRRGGRATLTAADCSLLATHPHLTASQRAEFAALAHGMIAKAVAR